MMDYNLSKFEDKIKFTLDILLMSNKSFFFIFQMKLDPSTKLNLFTFQQKQFSLTRDSTQTSLTHPSHSPSSCLTPMFWFQLSCSQSFLFCPWSSLLECVDISGMEMIKFHMDYRLPSAHFIKKKRFNLC